MLLVTVNGTLSAQAAVTVPASSSVYDRLESISARFPARGLFLGERALSRRELMRTTAILQRTIDSAGHRNARERERARAELELIRAELEGTRDSRPLGPGRLQGAWRADVFSSSARFERIATNGLGDIDAVSHPFIPARYGWPAVEGTIASIAPSGAWTTRTAFALVAQPLASLSSTAGTGWTSERLLHRAYVRAVYRNVAAQIGAEEHRWGQSPRGALFLSGNALPVPALSLGTDTAITLPWLFRYAGATRVTAFLADLGGTQQPPHARLAGWQASIQPWSRFELGVAVTAQTGGDGGPKATFLERFVDLFPVIDALAPQHADLQISNKLAGGNLRLRFPELSGLDFYYELQIDDFDGRRLRSSLVDDAAHLLGLRLPVLAGDDEIAWRMEWHRTSLRLYEHGQFRSGSTYRGRILGNPLGPHATGGYGSITWRASNGATVELSLAEESRDPSQYTVTIAGPRDQGFEFVRLTNDPDVRNRRAMLSLERLLPGSALRLSGGYNRASRAGLDGRDEWFGSLSLTSQRLTTF